MALCRELTLLGFIGAVTYVAIEYVVVGWSPAQSVTLGTTALVVSGAVALALVRRRFPVTALLATALLFGWFPATGGTLALASYCVAGATRSARLRGAAFVLAALIPFTVGLIGSGYRWAIVFVDFGVAALVCVAGPAMVHVLLDQRERLIGALREQAGYLRANQQLTASAARLQERSRIAQEMHDLLGHRLSLISMYAGSLELDTTTPPQVTEAALLIRNTVHTAMEELRATLGILCQHGTACSATEPTEHAGTWSDISRLIQLTQAGGVLVELTWTGHDLENTALPIRQAVHRIVREGLTNVCRHAAGAKARVAVAHETDRVLVEVSDNGGGAAGGPGSSLGLIGVRERVRLLGGSFSAGPVPGGGFRVSAELPLASAPPAPVEPTTEPEGNEKIEGSWARAAMSALLLTGMVGAVAIVVVTFNQVTFDIPPEATGFDGFDGITVGSTRAQVAEFIGADQPIAREAARRTEPHKLQGTDCWYSYGTEVESGRTMIERYCFRQDVLVDKARFGLPPT